MSATLTPDVCWHATMPDRSLSADTIGLGRLSSYATASRSATLRNDLPAVVRLLDALSKASAETGVRVTPATFSRTLGLLQVLPAHLPPPEIVVESEHEIGLDWDESYRRVLTVTVDATSRVGFSSLIGEDLQQGRLEFAEGSHQVPRVLGLLFSQLYPRFSAYVYR